MNLKVESNPWELKNVVNASGTKYGNGFSMRRGSFLWNAAMRG